MAAIGVVPLFCPRNRGTNSASASNFVLNQSTDQVTWIFSAPWTGPVLTKAAIRWGAITGSSPTFVLSLQGVDASGYADGTIKGGASPVSVEVTPAAGVAGTVVEHTFANSYDTTPGEMLALVLAPKAGTTIDGSNSWSVTYSMQAGRGFPYTVTTDNSTPTKRGAAVFMVGDGSTWWGTETINAATGVTVGSSPVHGGAKFVVPAGLGDTVSCVGWWSFAYWNTGLTYRASLYNEADTLLAQTDIDTDCNPSGLNQWYVEQFWDDGPITLTCGSTYRLVNTVVSSTGSVFYQAFAAAAHMDALPWQQESIWTQGTTGAWSDTATRRPMVGPIISDITKPAGGGGPVIGSRIVRRA